MTLRTLAAFIPTLLLVAMMGAGGVLDLLRTPDVMAVIHRLGYPTYFPLMLGAAKLLGVAALLLPVPRTLREWAYAGFTFDLVAAAVSHAAVGAPVSDLVAPVAGAALLAASYVLREKRRRKGDEEMTGDPGDQRPRS